MELYDEDVFDEQDQEEDADEADLTDDRDTQMDVDADDDDGEGEGEGDSGDDAGGASDDEPADAPDGPGGSAGSARAPRGDVVAGTYKQRFPMSVDPALAAATSFDVVPTTAFIHGGPVFSLALTWGAKYLFTGGEDGYIRRYNFTDSMKGKQLLSLGQRPAAIDTIVKSGILSSYWENEQPLFEGEYKYDAEGTYAPKLSPVYAMAVQSESLWLCAGLESGGITLQTIRHGEGLVQAYLNGHTNAVSDLLLDSAETHLLSGSWDKSVALWDLDTGKRTAQWARLPGQVSSLAWQPLDGPLLTPEDNDDNKSMGSLFGSDGEGGRGGGEDSGSGGGGSSAENGTANGQENGNGASKTATPSGGDGADGDAKDANGAAPPRNTTGSTFATSTINGQVEVWDLRSPTRCLALHSPNAPPWCMQACWSLDGASLFAGRRNSVVDEFDVRMGAEPRRSLRFPSISGAVTALAAAPNGRHLMCASSDNIRLYDLAAPAEQKRTPFYIIPGYHGALISRMILDPTGHYFVTASGGRGWQEGSSDVVLGYDVALEQRETQADEAD